MFLQHEIQSSYFQTSAFVERPGFYVNGCWYPPADTKTNGTYQPDGLWVPTRDQTEEANCHRNYDLMIVTRNIDTVLWQEDSARYSHMQDERFAIAAILDLAERSVPIKRASGLAHSLRQAIESEIMAMNIVINQWKVCRMCNGNAHNEWYHEHDIKKYNSAIDLAGYYLGECEKMQTIRCACGCENGNTHNRLIMDIIELGRVCPLRSEAMFNIGRTKIGDIYLADGWIGQEPPKQLVDNAYIRHRSKIMEDYMKKMRNCIETQLLQMRQIFAKTMMTYIRSLNHH